MTRSVVWLSEAMAAYRQLRAADPDGARRIAKSVAALADDPYPADSNPLGGTSFRRIRLDRYRVLYEVTDDAVRVMHVGRVIGDR
jgi:mRNA-degrading endonuclease RelE of RelBE toxin-antitoxin system